MTLYHHCSTMDRAGAGGIGVFLFDKLRSYENHDVTTILIIIVVTVAVIDRISAAIRTRYT